MKKERCNYMNNSWINLHPRNPRKLRRFDVDAT